MENDKLKAAFMLGRIESDFFAMATITSQPDEFIKDRSAMFDTVKQAILDE
ncbi:hypothetical protein [Weissella cibaria]|uniref:hypothetical protein n=1 Tax=Weissella cibaria TaxID=137591 RepID=UPI000AA7DC30|nr:hypothetical protein [Weissella cibaria]MCG4286946.1 hypothetical protein [Weissella cibaria]UOX37598.1 hypothetical protein IDM39_04785 [Weissella cibaria]